MRYSYVPALLLIVMAATSASAGETFTINQGDKIDKIDIGRWTISLANGLVGKVEGKVSTDGIHLYGIITTENGICGFRETEHMGSCEGISISETKV